MSWRLDLPLVQPLTLNARQHWAAKHLDVASLREAAHTLARQARIPACGKIHVQLHYVPPDNRHRDSDNLVATLKPTIDGIVDAGVVPEDTPRYVDWSRPIIDSVRKGKGNRLYVIITLVGSP